MSFDYTSFFTGLAEGVGEGIKRKGIEAREFEKDEKRRAQSNIATISQRRARVQQVMGYTKLLQDQGATNDQLQAIISSGPEQIRKLATSVQKAVEANNGQRLGAADITAMISMPEGFAPLDFGEGGIEEFVKRSYGTYMDPNAPQSAAEDISIWDRFTGDAAMKRVNAKLDANPVYQNLTAQDVNEMAAQQEYNALIPSTFAMVSDFNVFNSDAIIEANSNLANIRLDLNRNNDYEKALKILENTAISDEARAEAQATIDSLETEYFSPHFIGLEQKYGPQLLTGPLNIMRQMEQYMGIDYVNELKETYETGSSSKTVTVEEPVVVEGEEVVEGEGSAPEVVTTEILQNTTFMTGHTIEVQKNGDGLILGANILDSENKVVDTLDAQSAKAATEQFFSVDAGVVITAPPSLTDVSIDEMPVIEAKSITYEDWKELRNSADGRAKLKASGLPESRIGGWLERFATEEGLAMIDFKKKADPNKKYMLIIPDKNLGRPYQVSGSDLGYIPDLAFVRDGSKPTIREMTEEEIAILKEKPRKFLTMSGYKLGKMYGTQGNTIMMPKELSAAEVAANNDAAIKEILANDAALENRERASENPSKISIRGKAARMLDVPISTLVEMQDTGELTEMGLSLLVNSGQSMVDYLVKEGVSNTFEVYRALGEWADKNKKILPMNKSFLLKTVGKKALLEMDN
tara:strand:- start:36 stop:2111 length:2076 start_codon:yes stop_codon:yes gene_type:complete